ncbi:MAG: type IX secretion system membrane protein PorP/SprF [Saprospiraceae bacterium]
MTKILFFIFCIFCCFHLSAQDPAYHSFSQNRFLFNPSLTGSYGAQAWKVRSKAQWNNDGGGGYKTLSLLFEETMPCSVIDVGAKLNYNEEGAGLYQTLDFGFLTSAFVPFRLGKLHDHNARIGFDFSWGVNTIDYSRLIWSDQLDPKYGNINTTSFVPPNQGRSAWYMNPGLGLSLRSLWFKKSRKAVMTNVGIAMYRFYSLNDGNVNQSVSVLGLKNDNPFRMSAFVEAEFVPVYYGKRYISVRPVILYQKQGDIDYFETGMRFGYQKTAGIGFYYHFAPFNEFGQSPWITINTDVMIPVGNGKKLEMFVAYSESIGGVQNLLGPQIEIGFNFYLAKSSICNIMGMEDDVPYNTEYICPIMALTPGKRKMYENIWYKN